jgi:hexosaminidase
MKKILLACCGSLFSLLLFAQPSADIAIIPEPVSLQKQTGSFVLPKTILLGTSSDKESKQIAAMLSAQLSTPTGYTASVGSIKPTDVIQLLINTVYNKTLGDEGYTLEATAKKVVIKANKAAGLFYGTQTLLQLLPKEIVSKKVQKNIAWKLPCVTVSDYPRFGWRGLMFDVSRHFFTKQEVKDFIDDMAKYKYNLLHFHLTDDNGWRIEIKSHPKLTSVGAWSVKRIGSYNTFSAPTPDEPRDYGGFYTQDDIKELVRYAQERFINILPEVDVPGHSLATVASYPELSCTVPTSKYVVCSGEPIADWSTSPPTALVDNTLCPANENVYVFLDKVFTEVAQLFPFEYMHVGGDECMKNFWEKSAAVKQLMEKEGLKDMHEVQSYFEKRVTKIVESKGKKVIGWDEILEGGLAPNAVVMSWRGISGGIEAAKQGHEVVMSPTTFAYLDYMQGDALLEAPVYATLRLNKAYSFEPVPDGVDPKFIKGGQANLWTEQVYNTRHLQYMLWPRSLAIAESVWSPKDKKDWNRFTKKVETTFERMDVAQIKYARAMFDPIIDAKKDEKDVLAINLSSEVNGLDIYYSWDNSQPDNFYPKYSSTLYVPKDASMLKVITYRGGKPIGRQIDITVQELKKRAGIK